MIGGGSKLPSLISASKKPSSKFKISLVISHKSNSNGVAFAIKNKIPAVYFKLPDYRNRIHKGKKSARADYMQKLGWFITQREYAPKLLVLAGWDLILDKNFFNFFRSNFGDGYAAINLHPAIMPIKGEGKLIKLPDKTTTSVIKGEQEDVLKEVLQRKLSYFGPTIHFMVPVKFDTGTVIEREFIKVGKSKTIQELRKKLMPVEDRILIKSINKIITKHISRDS
ncbi:hypothetical protein A2164_01480 [Candidatus Curtissbacteria bacterium RBG_13_35_7]|uniref:phosphoribosylglycinamide formyltransferase 1 n=1 Tax=Candidatus Curtissbacteria bacterium RBG_13_35_7 TaxID=1797705 RepID=A0A1F5G1J7_9BACT|nr:MAG: hypothetical protein A2164_01480 [Candidatus Curtissbacteria bacterium RBG_13_35_7]